MQANTMQMQPMMAAAPMMKMAGAVPGGNRFQFFPVQVGAATPYARSRKWLFIGVSIYQLLMAIMALSEFQNFLSGIIMCIGCLMSIWILTQDMNITYVCWWGVICTIGCIAGLVGAFIGFAVKISTIVIKFNIPLSCFFGMVVAWWLFADYETNHPEATDMVGSWCRVLRFLGPQKAAQQPQAGVGLLGAGLPQFGGFDSIKGEAQQYGAMGQDKMAAMGQYGAMGQDKMAAMGQQAKAQEAGFAQGFGGFAGGNLFGTAPQQPAGAPGAPAQANAAQGGFAGGLAGAQGGFAGGLASAQGGFAGGLASAGGFASGMFGSQTQTAPAQAAPGQGDLRRDPFMTNSSLK